MVFQGNKLKAVTFSYDDGVEQDRRLISIFNKYNLKCTFNLNSGIQTGANSWENKGVLIRRLNLTAMKDLYAGHEIAVHTLTHPHLENQDDETIMNEIKQDKINLESAFNCDVVGMAYPYGTYDGRVIETLKKNNIKYARTVVSSGDFALPDNLLELKPTCHHNDPNLMKLAKAFVEMKPTEPKIFYIWGHSFELEVEKKWDMIEEFCAYISGRDDIFYGTNSEVLLV